MFIDKLKAAIRLLFQKNRASYRCFYTLLGFYPRTLALYEQALSHKSYSKGSYDGKSFNNERLEFLGDAILDAIVADLLYCRFETKREGFLTNMRSKIVQRETLNKLALEIGLDKRIKSTNQIHTPNSSMYGNALEALIGAIYLDQGYLQCKIFVEKRLIEPFINIEILVKKEINFKSKLIEWGQKKKVELVFELLDSHVDGDGNVVFETQVVIQSVVASIGVGYTKKESQQHAAEQALDRIKNDRSFFIEILKAEEAKRIAIQNRERVAAKDN